MLSAAEPPLIAKIEGPRLGESATFECPHGYRLEGASSMTCQYNGECTVLSVYALLRFPRPLTYTSITPFVSLSSCYFQLIEVEALPLLLL